MTKKQDIRETSYENQSRIFSDTSDEALRLAESWFDDWTADYWRHRRMYEAVDCVADKGSTKWLTVGDGRWGLDSIRMKRLGVNDVLPTDICETLLFEAKSRGLIEVYSVENAERLSFADNTFDYVFCKESYHHFPRPYIAMYEMLRVAKKAVFLAEPNDDPMPVSVSVNNFLKYKVKDFLARHGVGKRPDFWGKPCFYQGGYEESGNFVYSVSRREMEKLCQGLDMPQLVVKGLNDHYIKGCEFEPADESRSQIFRDIKTRIAQQDELCERGKAMYSMVLLGLFKVPMDMATRKSFKDHGFEVVDLPRNPYMR